MSLKRSIRRALESALKPAMVTAEIKIQWPDLALDRNKLTEYVRFSLHLPRIRVLELGTAPLKNQAGFAKIGVFTRVGRGQDRNDTICGLVAAAFPYATTLTFGDIKVILDTCDQGDFVPSDAAWMYAPVNVNFNVWNRG